MNLLKYSTTIEKKIHGNSDLYIDSHMKMIQGKLRNIDIRSEIMNDTIIFKRTVRIASDCGYSKKEALKILREGHFRIKKNKSNNIEIFWEVKLDSLLFLSIVIGIILGIILGLFVGSGGIMIISSIIIGLVISTIAYLFGFSFILITIDDILETSI